MTPEHRKRMRQQWKEQNPDKVKAHRAATYQRHKDTTRKRNLRNRFGLTPEGLLSLYNSQQGACAICGLPLTLEPGRQQDAAHVDHDHSTGKVRGLLCVTCNSGIGHLQDDPYLLRRAADYVSA